MEHEIIRVACSKPPRGRLAALGARKTVTRPAKRIKTSKENTENRSAGVSVCVPPPNDQGTGRVPLTQAQARPPTPEEFGERERVALEIRLGVNVDSENVQFVLSSKTTDIYVLVDGKPKTKRSKKLPSVYASVLAPLMDKGLATLEFKSIGCPGYIHVEVVGTKLQPILPPAVQELESAWED